MKSYRTLAITSVVCSMFAVAAHADCAADLAKLDGTKDMSTATSTAMDKAENTDMTSTAKAPETGAKATLSTDAGAAVATNNADAAMKPKTEAAEETKGIAKDGSLAPLESAPGESSDQAMSGQDAQAQQKGTATDAEQAATKGTADHDSLIKDAKTALAAGDEAACQEAVDKAAAL